MRLAVVLLATAACVLSACRTRDSQVEEADLAVGVAPRWQLPGPLSSADKTDVLALAAQMGIGRVAVVSSDCVNFLGDCPPGCSILHIESVRSSNGRRSTWKTAEITNASGPQP